MSVKKLLILTAAGVASVGLTAAIAGGPTDMAPPAPVAASYFYVEGNVGYASQDFAGSPFMGGPGAVGVLGPGSQGGWAYGADIGYMFNQYVGAEVGWTYLPRFGSTSTGSAVPGSFILRSTNGTWIVLKLVAPLTENLDAFVKAGLGYRYGRIIWLAPAVVSSSRMEELRPLFAAGGTYNIGQEWMASVQFMHFMGGTTYNSMGAPVALNSVVAPASNVLTLDVGYKFTV